MNSLFMQGLGMKLEKFPPLMMEQMDIPTDLVKRPESTKNMLAAPKGMTVNNIAGMASSLIPSRTNFLNDNEQKISTGYDSAASAASMIPGAGQVIGLGLKGLGFLSGAVGKGDKYGKASKFGAGLRNVLNFGQSGGYKKRQKLGNSRMHDAVGQENMDLATQSAMMYSKKGGCLECGGKLKKLSYYKSGGSIDKSTLTPNKPRRTPNHPTKSHVVLAKENGKEKLIRFGQQGVKGAGSNPKSAKQKARRKSFKARHAKNISKGKMSAAWWSDKIKWEKGGIVSDKSNSPKQFVLSSQKRNHTLDGYKLVKDNTSSIKGYLKNIDDTKGLKQVGSNLFTSLSKGGNMIKRKDGSYSKRGLWDQIRTKRKRVGKSNMPSKSEGTVTDKAIKQSQKQGGVIKLVRNNV